VSVYEDHYALPPGYHLEQYRINGVLGQGGFGITYVAHDRQLGRLVAIKEYLPSDLAARADSSIVGPRSTSMKADYTWGLERFLNEARTLARFRHPNIVQVLTFFQANGTAYIVMAYEDGRSLDVYLAERGGTLPNQELLRLTMPLLDGLEAVHREGFLHRDIKPSNIFVRANASPMLIDFGTARQVVGSRSHSIASILTPGYAPFEQYTVGGNQGSWSDIYGLGAVLYRCVSGRLPPDASSRMEAWATGEPDPLEPAVTVGQGRYPTSVLKAIDWALAVLARERPQSVAEFREAITSTGVPKTNAASAGKPLASTGPVESTIAGQPARKKPRSPWWIVPAGGGLALLLAVAAHVLVSQSPSPGDQAGSVNHPAAETPVDTGPAPPQIPAPLQPDPGATVAPVNQPPVEIAAVPEPAPPVNVTPNDQEGGTLAIRSMPVDEPPTDRVETPASAPSPLPIVEPDRRLIVVDGVDAVPMAIAPPTDPGGGPLRITVTEVPSLGSVGSGDQPVQAGQSITGEALAGLLYSAPPGRIGEAGAFRYSVQNARGESVAGTVAIELTSIQQQPQIEIQRTVRVPLNSKGAALGIRPPRSGEGGDLTIRVTQIPALGTVLDGDSAVQIGTRLSTAQLANLTYRPHPDYDGEAGWLRYIVSTHNGGRAETGIRIEVDPGDLYSDQLEALEIGLPAEEIKRIQQSLRQLGLYRGSTDGSFGDRTRTAIRAFQATLGESETGFLSNRQRLNLHRRADGRTSPKELAMLEAAWNQQDRMRIQRGLQLLGHYGGRRDGNFDAVTRNGIRAFQHALGAEETGYLSNGQRLILAVNAAEAAASQAEWAARAGRMAAAQARLAAARSVDRPDAQEAVPVRNYPDGTVYRGELDGDLRNGFGIMIWPDGHRYEGEWRDDARSGVGVLYYQAYRIEMEVRDETTGGFAVQIRNDGTRYAGEWRQGVANGYGVQTALGFGSRFAGEWAPDPRTRHSYRNGYVLQSSNSGERYGEWRFDELIRELPPP
jgi:serine/threonine protein kinase/peptidoglycan hydrolase-like protein with peptidoglycan-binding domain